MSLDRLSEDARETTRLNLTSSGGGCTAAFEWRAPGDLLLIDNARMLHRATTRHMPVGCRRKMLRVSIAGSVPLAAHGT